MSSIDLQPVAFPAYIEPRQTAARVPPRPTLRTTPCPLLKPTQGPNPRLGLNTTKVILLAMQIGRNIGAQKGEERGNGERFVTITQNLEVDGIVIEHDAEPCDDRVYRNHP